jgi:hypothetical protein
MIETSEYTYPPQRRKGLKRNAGRACPCILTYAVRSILFLSGIAVASGGFAEETPLGRMLLSEAALQEAERRGELYRRQAQPLEEEVADTKSYLVPALEIPTFIFLLNRFNNQFVGSDFDVTLSSIKRNLRSGFVTDRDSFIINQLGHPYQGSVYYGLARSAGLNFWESFGYTFAGSTLWEIAGETTLPSRNDQFTTTFAGTFLGESLFRMANLVLESDNGSPGYWRELAAAAISPPTAFNRTVFPQRFGNVFLSQNPATFSRLQLGASGTLRSSSATSSELTRNEAIADFLLEYGLPGKPGYEYSRPFDYFSFQVSASSAEIVESLHNRGLILGKSYEAGPNYRGIWGLYGSYDYLSPQLFRLSSAALSLGTTVQWRLSNSVAVQGTATAGAGYTAAGTIRDSAERDFSYGFAPQALLALRINFGNAASFDMSARKYFAREAGDRAGLEKDSVFRADASFTVRLHGNHAVAVKYITSRRDASFSDLGERVQRRDSVGIYYTYLFSGGFGTVAW